MIRQQIYQLMVVIDPNDIGYTGYETNADNGVQSIVNNVYLLAGMVAVLTIVIAGYVYVTSRGNQARIKQAKNAIVASLTGIVIIMSAFIITQFIIFGVTR